MLVMGIYDLLFTHMLKCPTCGRHYSSDVRDCPEDGTPLMADSTVAIQIPVDPLIGKVFDGKYRLEALIGLGGMGAVYRATHLLIDRPVAIKVLRPRFVEDEAARVRFHREARAAGRLQHTNAVTVTDFGSTDDGYVYIVMELLEGRSLRAVLACDAPLEQGRAVSIMLQVSAAVAAAHEAGIIHRDLKPANIFIQQRKHAPPVVKVLDFGIAKVAAESLEESDQQSLTLTGVMIGTPRYMSPEQCEGKPLTPAADIYSLGIILYEMLSGTTPFSGSSPLAVAMKHSSETPRSPREFVSNIDPEIEAVVLHALVKDPSLRSANGGEFRRELYAVSQRLGIEQFSAGSMPTMETLRNAGIESPSGRLVVDMGRLRSNSFNTSDIQEKGSTNGGESPPQTEQVTVVRELAASGERKSNPTADVAFSRVDVPFRRRRAWVPLTVALVLGAFVLGLVAAAAYWRSNLRQGTTPVTPGVANTSGAAAVSPTAAPRPTPVESPKSTPDSADNSNSNKPEEKRQARKDEKEPVKKESKVKSILRKAGRILKKPF